MSSPPSRRHYTANIFRGHGTSTHSTQPGISSGITFPSEDKAFSDGEQALETPARTRMLSTRIPLFGRSRKKSAHSAVAQPRTSEPHSERASMSRHQDEQPAQGRASTSQLSLASSNAQPSLGSKIVARLSPRKSHKRTADAPVSDASDYMSEPLPAPLKLRPSTESRSSRRSSRRSATPRPVIQQPTITVSHPDSEDLSEYEDLFTKPRQKPKSKLAPLEVPPKEKRQDARDSTTSTESSASSLYGLALSETTTRSSDTSSPPATPSATGPPVLVGVKVFPDEPGIISNSQVRTLPKSRIFASDTEVSSAAEESDAMSVMSLPLLDSLATRRHRRSYASRTRAPTSNPSEKTRHGLLMAPSTNPPSIPLPLIPNGATRPRANTVSSPPLPTPEALLKRHHSTSTSRTLLSSPPTPKDQAAEQDSSLNAPSTISHKSTGNRSSSSSSSSSSTPTLKLSYPSVQPLDIDLDKATTEELRLALRQRNMQLENLASHIQKVTDLHAQEKAQLEKQILQLERDVSRRDKEIKGPNWLMRNGSDVNDRDVSIRSSLTTPELDKDRSDESSRSTHIPTPTSSARIHLYRNLNAEDSGAESYGTSGTESIKGSRTSGSEFGEASKPRHAMRKLKLVEGFQSLNGGTSPFRMTSSHQTASSIYSTSISGSTPLSSPITATFTSPKNLSTIPEATRSRTSSIPHPKQQIPSEKNPVRERRVSTTSSSTSSKPQKPPSSRPTPSEAYARNAANDRSPSIAQLLNTPQPPSNTPPIMSQSFGGRSRTLLGLVSHKKKSTLTPAR